MNGYTFPQVRGLNYPFTRLLHQQIVGIKEVYRKGFSQIPRVNGYFRAFPQVDGSEGTTRSVPATPANICWEAL